MSGIAPDPAKRRELYEKMQWVLAGASPVDALAAAADTLGGLIAFTVEDRAGVRPMLDVLVADLERHIARNWDYIRQIRDATAAPPQGHA